MKRLIILLFLNVLIIRIYSQNIYSLNIKSDSSDQTFFTSEIDSITFSYERNQYYQNIWRRGVSIKNKVSSLNSVPIKSNSYEYRVLEKASDGVDAIITETGDFCILKEFDIRNDSLVAIWGNAIFNEYNYALIDSLGFINTIIIKDDVYDIIYGNDSIAIMCNNNWICNVCYEDLGEEMDVAYSTMLHAPMRASWLTRNPVYKTLNVLNSIIGLVSNPSKQLLLYYLRNYGMGNQDLNNFLTDIGDFDLLKLIEWLDNLFDYYYFGDNSVKTLDPVKIKTCNYDLSCQINISGEETPYYKVMESLGVSYSFSLTMTLKDTSLGGKSQLKTRYLLDTDIITFNFSNLNLETYYSFEPRLDVEYQISDKAYFLSIGIPEEKIRPRTVKHTKYGEKKEFFTGSVGCSVGEATNIRAKSADIECSYSNVPEGASCGIKLIRNKDKQESFVPNGSTDGKRTANATNLEPSTEYAYIGCVKYNGNEYLSWNAGSFTTKKPFCSTGEVVSKTHKSAVVKCTYNLAEGFECGVMVSSDSGSKKFTTSSEDGERSISLSGLTPSTTYNYWAYVLIDGVPENGEVKSFTTKAPPTPIATTGGYSDVTTNSAIVECSFENVPEGGKCYVYLHWIDDWGYNMDNSFSSSEGINKKITCSGLTPATTYYYTATISYDGNEYNGEEKSFTTKGRNLCPDENHPHAIDLGLPSGTKWCCCNLGASRPEDCGGYYTWDEIQQLEEPWSVPEWRLISELVYECYWVQYTKINGVDGYYFKAKNKNELFLPAAGVLYNSEPYNPERGYYWSCDPDDVPAHKDDAIYYWFDYWGHDINHMYRGTHLSVRPICQ